MSDLIHDLALAEAERQGTIALALEIVELAEERYDEAVRHALLAEIGRLLDALHIDDDDIRQRCRMQWGDADVDTLRHVVESLRETLAEIVIAMEDLECSENRGEAA